MPRNAPLALAALLAPAVFAAGAHATLFYSNNFERSGPFPEWSANQTYTNNANFSKFLGRYTNSTVTLTLAAPPGPRDEGVPGGDGGGGGGGGGTPPPPPPRGYLLTFSFYCIDSWDGNDTTNGPDHFAIRVNGEFVFNETFANQHEWQSYHHSPDVGRTQLGFDQRWNDSIYYTVSVPFATDASTLHIDFLAYGLLGPMSDESWGIDNVNVSTVPVPAPAGAGLLGLGALGLLRRRRR